MIDSLRVYNKVSRSVFIVIKQRFYFLFWQIMSSSCKASTSRFSLLLQFFCMNDDTSTLIEKRFIQLKFSVLFKTINARALIDFQSSNIICHRHYQSTISHRLSYSFIHVLLWIISWIISLVFNRVSNYSFLQSWANHEITMTID